MRHRTLLSLTLVMACGDSVAADEDSSAGSTSAGTSSVGSTSGEAPTEAGSSSGVGEESTGEPFVPIPARGGPAMVKVEANPGVAIVLEQGGVPLPGSQRNAYMPKNRDTLVRVWLDVPDDWVARPIEARLELSGGGVAATLSDTFQIAGDTYDNDLQSGPYFGVPAEHVVPGVKYQVSLWEAAPGQEGLPEPTQPPVTPTDGPAFLGVESDFAELKVVLVPVDYDYGGCARVVDGEGLRQEYLDALLQQNGVESVQMTVHAPYEVRYDLREFNGLSDLVGEMSQLRAAESAAPNVYYYALFDSCGACISSGNGGLGGCTVGLAFDITGPDMGDAYARAAAGQLKGSAEETFVHEIGHTQGRRHVECGSGNAQGTDPSYPYESGVIGVWGFGIRDYRLRHPTANADYMSYCGKVWASDWEWNATYKRIIELSSWDQGGAPAPTPIGPGMLVGTIDPEGREAWWTVPGEFIAARAGATHAIGFESAAGRVTAAAEVRVRPGWPTKIVVTGLPPGFDERALTGLHVRDEQGERPIALDKVRWLHGPSHVAAGSPR